MAKNSNIAVGVLLFYSVLVLGLGVGWIMNIIAIVHSNFSPISGMLVARVIGVFVAPLGSVLGYF